MDETGAKLDKHILLFLIMFFISMLIFLYSHFRRFLFNEELFKNANELEKKMKEKGIEIKG